MDYYIKLLKITIDPSMNSYPKYTISFTILITPDLTALFFFLIVDRLTLFPTLPASLLVRLDLISSFWMDG